MNLAEAEVFLVDLRRLHRRLIDMRQMEVLSRTQAIGPAALPVRKAPRSSFMNPCPMSHLHPVGAGKMCIPVPGESRSDAHDLARRRRIDLHAVPDVDADM